MEYSALLQLSTEQRCLSACFLYNTVISLVSKYHHHPSVRHFSNTVRYLTWSDNCTYTSQKNIWWSRLFIFWQCLFCHQNADGNSLAGAVVPPVRSLAETKWKRKINR